MKVIVAGYPKTGTKSMNAALTLLGYTVHDYLENVVLHREEYKKIFNEGWKTDDFRKMYENVDAVTDIPACLFWDEIHKAFPEAKIILTMRENEETWVESFARQCRADTDLYNVFLSKFSPVYSRALRDVTNPSYPVMFGQRKPLSSGLSLNKEMAKKVYRTHNAYVMQTAPKDKLLVFKCSEGWEPLCKFLDVPIPIEPFPHANQKATYRKEVANHPLQLKIRREAKIFLITSVVSVGAILYCCIKYAPSLVRGLKTFMVKS